MRTLFSVLIFVAITAVTPAYAHAHLKRAVPAVGSEVSPGPSTLRLSFSEGIELPFSHIEIAMGDGMAIAPSAVALDPNDPSVIVVTLLGPLAPGHYDVAWHVVSVDTHKTQGHYEFTVMP